MSNTSTTVCRDPKCIPDFRCEACVAAHLAIVDPDVLNSPLWTRLAGSDVQRDRTPAPASSGGGSTPSNGRAHWGKWGNEWAIAIQGTLTEGDTIAVYKRNGDSRDVIVGEALGTIRGEAYYRVGTGDTVEARWTKWTDDSWVLVVPQGRATTGDTVTIVRSSGESRDGKLGECLGLRGDRDVFREAAEVVEPTAPITPADTTVTPLDLHPLFDGLTTQSGDDRTTIWVAAPGGDTRLKLKIDRPRDGKWAGYVFVKDAAEYGTGRKYGSQRPGGFYNGDVRAELEAILADRDGALAAYGQLVGSCGACGRTLEDETSLRFGVGPRCRAKLGM